TVSGSDLDLDVSADDAHVVAGDRFVCWVAQDLASADVEFCAVPRAGHLVPLDLTLGKRSFLVRAEIVEREELAADIEQSNLFAFEHDQEGVTGRDLGRARGPDEFAHELVLLENQTPARWRRSGCWAALHMDGALVDGKRRFLHRLVEGRVRMADARQ